MKRFVFLVLSFLVVLTPLIFSPRSSELFEFPKLLLIYLGASLLLPLIIFNFPKLKRRLWKNQPPLLRITLLAVLLFLTSQLASAWLSIDNHTSFFGYYSRFNGGLLSLIAYLIIFFSALGFLTRERVLLLLKITLYSGLVVALWGLPSHFGYDFICLAATKRLDAGCWTADFVPQVRLFSTLGQPNWLATYLLILINITLYFLVSNQALLPKKSKKHSSLLAGLLFVLFSVELLWTNSRSGLLTYGITNLFFFCAYFLKQRKALFKLSRPVIYLPLFTFLAILIVTAWPILSSIKVLNHNLTSTQSQQSRRLKTNSDKNQTLITPSSQIRLIVWQGAWQLAHKYPWFGTGVETFAIAYNFTRPVAHNLTSEWNFVYNKAHNELLNYLATTGWVGLSSYLLLFMIFLTPAGLVLLKPAGINLDHWQFSLFYLTTIVGIFIMNLFGFSTTVTSLFYYLLPALILVYGQNPAPAKTESINERSLTRELNFGQVALYFAWLLFCSVYLLNYFTADYHYARAREFRQIQDFTNAYINGQKALDLRREPTYLDQQAGIAANLAALQQIQRNNPQAKQFSQQAIDYNNEALSQSSKNVFYYKTRAKIFYTLSLSFVDNPTLSSQYLFKAIQALKTAQRLAPTDPIIPFTLAGLIQINEPDQAVNLLKTAIILKPNYTEANDLLQQLQNFQKN